MTVHQYAVGMGATLAVVLCATVVGMVCRRLFAPRWTGARAALVVVVSAYSFLVIEGELLGTFGQFKRVPILIASAATALVALLVGRGRGPGRHHSPYPSRFGTVPAPAADAVDDPGEEQEPTRRGLLRRSTGGLSSWMASCCAALALAPGLVAARATMQTGILWIDSLQYHLTDAAMFAATHHTGRITQLAPGVPVSYYPLNSELLHGIGIALLGRDSLSLLLTFADLAATLLAVWCVGSAFDLGPVAVCAISPLLAALSAFDANAMNDWAALWPFIAVLAIAAHLRKDGEGATVGLPFAAGLAGGLAMGTKLSLLAPCGALLVGFLVVVPGRRRPIAAVLVVLGAALTSTYWYIRDIVAVGSPLPGERIPGLPRVPMAVIQQLGFSVAHYLGNRTVISTFFRPGLESFFGKAWIAVLGLALLGVILGLLLGPAVPRTAAVVAVIGVGAYLVTPSGAFGLPGVPYLFSINLRYALPAVSLGLLMLAVSWFARRWQVVVSVGFLACVVVTLLGPHLWVLGSAACAAAAAVALLTAVAVRLPAVRRHGAVLAVVAVLAAAVVGYPVQQSYLRDRYPAKADPLSAIYHALNDRSHVRVGVVGPALYPFLGPTFTNTVQYVGETEAHHAFVDYPDCTSWRAAVAADGDAYVVVEVYDGDTPPALEWALTDPSATAVVTNDAGGVFAVGPGFGTAPCSG